MKKFIILSVSLFSLLLVTQAKAQVFEKGTKLIDAGFEFQESFEETVIPVFGAFEIGVTDDIGVGAKMRFWSKHDVNSLVIQATGAYHFGRFIPVEKLDVFGSLGLGVNRIWVSDYAEYSASSFMISPQIGARYFFTEKFGVTAKLGVDSYRYDDGYYDYGSRYTDVNLALGVSFKF
ncbi:hypothetical protein DYBT9275_04454 [Dyadobacter sp. CECT 9275]|uniref:Outer membrane protein beta-barrel domain-containing protein n=1 Tax=Dyadobacter helix TaxID=2822344 RepID=A0A916JG01_9BACT|nr:hypothetical protein [Dyadobacter sp. CECT 9275]CAG5009248.1 hypothetical protein DYBT9275_04454 [Dyadobacter sp. CECT 9275]